MQIGSTTISSRLFELLIVRQAKRYYLRCGIERYFSLVPKGLSYPYAFNTALPRLGAS